MKMAISFICGAIVCAMIIIGIRPGMPVLAEDMAPVTEDTDNITQTLTGAINNFDKIYRDALTMPFVKAQAKIYDDDISAYYQELMLKTGLTNQSENSR